jgi:type I restriction enzyme S subunit
MHVLGQSAVVGKSAPLLGEWNGSVGAFCAIVRPKVEFIDPAYLALYMRSYGFRSWTRMSEGINIKNIRHSELSRAENIARMRREAEQKAKEIIPALFLDMFGDPATNPKGYLIAPLGDLFAQKPNYGTMIPAKTELLPWLCLRVANIQDGRLTLTDRKYVSLPDVHVARHEIQAGDILMARAIGSLEHLGKCVVASPGAEKWAFDSHLMRVRLQGSRANPVWLQALLSSEGGRRLFLEKTRRTAVQFNINVGEMAAILVPLPPIARQNAFETRVQALHRFEAQQVTASALAAHVFQSLLARVFGEPG